MLSTTALAGFKPINVIAIAFDDLARSLYYPVSCTIVRLHLPSNRQVFLEGHKNQVVHLELSPNRRLLLSAERVLAGLRSDVFIWDTETASIICCFKDHLNEVACARFSADSTLVASVHRSQKSSFMVVWQASSANVVNKKLVDQPIRCLAFIGSEKFVYCVKNQIFIVDVKGRFQEKFAQLGRREAIVRVELWGETLLFLLADNQVAELPLRKGSTKERVFDLGLNREKFSATCIVGPRTMLVCLSSGRLVKVDYYSKKVLKEVKLEHPTTLLQYLRGSVFGCTQKGIYSINGDSLEPRLIVTSFEPSKINACAIPRNFNSVIALCQGQTLRLLRIEQFRLIFIIRVKGVACLSAGFDYEGKRLISGWDDGCIRIFTPQTGKLMAQVEKAHDCGIVRLQITVDGLRIISGDSRGVISFWRVDSAICRKDCTFNVLGSGIVSMDLCEDGYLFAASEENVLAAINSISLEVLFTYSIKNGFITYSAILDNFIYCATNSGALLQIARGSFDVRHFSLPEHQQVRLIKKLFGDKILLAGDDGFCLMYQMHKKKLLPKYYMKLHHGSVIEAFQLDDGELLTVGEHEIVLRRKENWAVLQQLEAVAQVFELDKDGKSKPGI